MANKKQYWPILKALGEAKKQGIEVSRPTLIKWIEKYGIGFQLGDKGGKWYLYPEKFLRYINNDGNSTRAKNKKDDNTIESDYVNTPGSVACESGSTNEKSTGTEKRKS